MNLMVDKVNLNWDYRYSYPQGHFAAPRLEVLTGEYEGLILDLNESNITQLDGIEGSKLNINFTIQNGWESDNYDVVNKTIKMTEKDMKFIRLLVSSYLLDIKDKDNKGTGNDITS